jgi:hypothetical protein
MRLWSACSIGLLISASLWNLLTVENLGTRLLNSELKFAFVRVRSSVVGRNHIPAALDVGRISPLNSALEGCNGESQQKHSLVFTNFSFTHPRRTEEESFKMAFGRLLSTCAASMAIVGLVTAHGGGAHQKPLQVDPEADWATRHMAGTVQTPYSSNSQSNTCDQQRSITSATSTQRASSPCTTTTTTVSGTRRKSSKHTAWKTQAPKTCHRSRKIRL